MNEIYLTRRQIAEKLQVVPKTVKNWEDRGILKPHKIGRVIRYIETEVNAAISADTKGAGPIEKEAGNG